MTDSMSNMFEKNGAASKKDSTSAPFSLRLTFEERALLEQAAGDMPLGAYIRSKLFEGEITETVMSDVFDITFDIDARQVYNNLRFQPVFDIETF